MTDKELNVMLESVRRKCAFLDVSFSLEWNPGEGLWYTSARGQAKGEYWEAKKISSPENALKYLARNLEKEVQKRTARLEQDSKS